jgi:hypothetical protein
LEEAIEMLLLAPASAEVVVPDFASFELAHSGIAPIRQLDAQTSDLAAEQSVGALDGRGRSEAIAGSRDGCGVSDFGLNLNDV